MVNDTNEKISKLWFYLHSLNAVLDDMREARNLAGRNDTRSQALLDTAESLLKQLENEIKGIEK